MSKLCMKERNRKRADLAKKHGARRKKLKAVIMNRELPIEERFAAQMKLAQLPRNSAEIRFRNRCELTGRPRAFYRKFKLCRNKLRELGSFGLIPGLVKSSW
ncbi:MAG: 30S ribosomal protein S14 [Alphaproteobacteria bacterium]|nr:30S ribosomal protein S14 [Alphaproteobacteria bacterium]